MALSVEKEACSKDKTFSIWRRWKGTMAEETAPVMAGSLCNARRGTRQVACNQPSPRLQLTCEAGDGILAGPLLRMLAGLRAAKGERVGLALSLALVPALCTCRHGSRGRRQATGHCRRAELCVTLHVCQVSLQERLDSWTPGRPCSVCSRSWSSTPQVWP